MQRLKQMLSAGNTVLSAWSGIADSHYVGAVAGHGFDAVCLDIQHGFFDESSTRANIATLVARGKAPLVRIPIGRWDTAARMMDFGALGVIAPMINSAADAKLLAAATRYTPTGERSFGPGYAAGLYHLGVNEYLESVDDCSLVLAMIETCDACNNLDEILEVDGIDGILIGPSDLSISLRKNRIPDPYGAESIDVVRDILGRCTQAGKKTSAYTDNPETANMLNELGVDMIALGNDQNYIRAGVEPLINGLNFR